ncbi:ABC transporter permease [Pseudonocardia sp. N23]|uniref:ABC transporter permease n=1 Tax=Pseudonocardia sp. N23 TaxID=1987376 RepID=UPI000BFC35FB|nr:ABC transporter permease [Pseudonocardia sp. N23]GAY08165.1 nucleoside ABC transporter, permease protein 1 [Pseudonocardia sp. N23]
MNRQALRGLLVSVLAVVLALAASLAVIALTGAPVGKAAAAMWDGVFGSPAQFGATLTKFVPLVLAAIGWVIASRAGRLNVGLEGQILAGGTTAAVVGLYLTGLPTVLHLTIAVLAGAVGGALLGGVAAWLWARRGVNDFIATLLLTLIMTQVVSWLANGPMEEPTGTLGQSASVADSARWPVLLPRTTLRADIILVIILVLVAAYVLRRTVVGYRLRLTGANESAARATGTRTTLVGVAALCASAAVAGVAGSSLVLAAPAANLAPGFSAGYGFDGIVVALLARNSPLGCIPAALLLAALRQGGGLLEARVGISSGLVTATQAVVILLVTGTAWYADRRRSRSRPPGAADVAAPVAEGARS